MFTILTNLIKQLIYKISKSLNGDSNEVSTSRLQSYIVLVPIISMSLIFTLIEIWSFLHAINAGTSYRLSNEIMVIYGMLLSHHLGLLFSRNKPISPDDGQSNIDNTNSNITQIENSVTKTVTKTS